MLDFSYYSFKLKYCDDSNKLAVDKMKDGAGAAIEKFVGLKPQMYSFLQMIAVSTKWKQCE